MEEKKYINSYDYEEEVVEKCNKVQKMLFYDTANKESFGIKKQLNGLIKKILSKVLPYEIEIEGIENVPSGANIFANSHQDFNDIVNSIYACPSHFYTLNSSNINIFLKALLNINGVVFVDRFSNDSKAKSKQEMIDHLKKGESINIYPEGTWNCSPNKLHLPLYKGIIEMSKETGRPIIPVAQEYKYEYDTKGNLNVKKVYIEFGKPFYVNKQDDAIQKLTEFDEELSTLQWQLIEKTEEVKKRHEIDEKYYIDLIEKKEQSVVQTGSNLSDEERAIYHYDDEFYQFFPANKDDRLRK